MRYAIAGALGTLLFCAPAQAQAPKWEKSYKWARARALREDKLLFLALNAKW